MLVKMFAHTRQVGVAVVAWASSVKTARNRAENASSSGRGLIAYVNLPSAIARNCGLSV